VGTNPFFGFLSAHSSEPALSMLKKFCVNILNEVDQILHVLSSGGLGYIHYAFFLPGCQTEGDIITVPV
jgi:hypothetical protein